MTTIIVALVGCILKRSNSITTLTFPETLVPESMWKGPRWALSVVWFLPTWALERDPPRTLSNTNCSTSKIITKVPYLDPDSTVSDLTTFLPENPSLLPNVCSQERFVASVAHLWYQITIDATDQQQQQQQQQGEDDVCLQASSGHYMAVYEQYNNSCLEQDFQCVHESSPIHLLPRKITNGIDIVQWRVPTSSANNQTQQQWTYQLLVTVPPTLTTLDPDQSWNILSLTSQTPCPTHDKCTRPKSIQPPLFDLLDTNAYAKSAGDDIVSVDEDGSSTPITNPASACPNFQDATAQTIWYQIKGPSSPTTTSDDCYCAELRANWPAILGLYNSTNENDCTSLQCMDTTDFTSESLVWRGSTPSLYRLAVSGLSSDRPLKGIFNLTLVQVDTTTCSPTIGHVTKVPGSCSELTVVTSPPVPIPTTEPTPFPTTNPPTSAPSNVPTTSTPSIAPTAQPQTLSPTSQVTARPTNSPFAIPPSPTGGVPSPEPPASFTDLPTPTPTAESSTGRPSILPTFQTTDIPTSSPSIAPTGPTTSPTRTFSPTERPSDVPSQIPSDAPSSVPTLTAVPTVSIVPRENVSVPTVPVTNTNDPTTVTTTSTSQATHYWIGTRVGTMLLAVWTFIYLV